MSTQTNEMPMRHGFPFEQASCSPERTPAASPGREPRTLRHFLLEHYKLQKLDDRRTVTEIDLQGLDDPSPAADV